MKPSLHVVLVEPEIHWNTGNIGRTCLAAGAQLHLVEPLGFSIDDKAVRRAGLDYWHRVAPQIWPSWAVFERVLPELGQPVVASPDGPKMYWEANFERPCVLIFGKESAGLSDSIRKNYAECLVQIPIEDSQVRSINLSTCVGIVVYEAVRQRATSQ